MNQLTQVLRYEVHVPSPPPSPSSNASSLASLWSHVSDPLLILGRLLFSLFPLPLCLSTHASYIFTLACQLPHSPPSFTLALHCLAAGLTFFPKLPVVHLHYTLPSVCTTRRCVSNFLEGNRSRIDATGQAFLSFLFCFYNLTIPQIQPTWSPLTMSLRLLFIHLPLCVLISCTILTGLHAQPDLDITQVSIASITSDGSCVDQYPFAFN